MKRIIITIIFVITVITAALGQKKVENTPVQLIPDLSTHYDRLMACIDQDVRMLFHDDVDTDRLEAANEDGTSLSGTLIDDMVDYAKQFIGSRYRSGGKGPKVFDCSGFTSFIFRYFGINLFSSSRSQSSQGEKVHLSEAKVGDLIFFSGRRGGRRVGHVGIIVEVKDNGTLKFIHASSSKGVVIQSYPDGGYYSKRFLSTRRIIG